MVQLQGTPEPYAGLIKLTESPIAEPTLLVEDSFFSVLGNSGFEHIPRLRSGGGVQNPEIHGPETGLPGLRITYGDVQNVGAARLLIERKLFSRHQRTGGIELLPVDFVSDLGGAAGGGGAAENVFHFKFLAKTLSRI